MGKVAPNGQIDIASLRSSASTWTSRRTAAGNFLDLLLLLLMMHVHRRLTGNSTLTGRWSVICGKEMEEGVLRLDASKFNDYLILRVVGLP